ncbi:hypothetical protein BC830DRAFT_1138441 [Chytriomyces sp. MP71]|nr:hypothetical protein BC830DRAFT_1138441 [Chytriomyces sp. MP71]
MALGLCIQSRPCHPHRTPRVSMRCLLKVQRHKLQTDFSLHDLKWPPPSTRRQGFNERRNIALDQGEKDDSAGHEGNEGKRHQDPGKREGRHKLVSIPDFRLPSRGVCRLGWLRVGFLVGAPREGRDSLTRGFAVAKACVRLHQHVQHLRDADG